ncbi:MAG: flavin reductase [Gemmatimonadota bacterium]
MPDAERGKPEGLLALDLDPPIWERVFTVAPLVVIGTREGDRYDLAPKHLVMPLGWGRHFGFMCSPRHSTYHNARREGAFTVSFPRPTQILSAALAATPREGWAGEKPIVSALPTFRAGTIDGVLLEDAYLFLECRLHRVVDGFGEYSLISGRIVAAYADRNAVRITEKEDQELVHQSPLLAYLSPGRFSTIRRSHAFPFPAGFRR